MTRKVTTTISADEAKAAFERIESGQSTVKDESRRAGYLYNGPLRKAIVSLVGRERYFEAAYRSLRSANKKKSPSGTK